MMYDKRYRAYHGKFLFSDFLLQSVSIIYFSRQQTQVKVAGSTLLLTGETG